MKQFTYVLAIFAVAILASACNGSKSGKGEELALTDSLGYYLHGGKVCLHNFNNDKVTTLDITDKEIVDFWLSPGNSYLACLKQKEKSDCISFNSLLIYDIKKKEVVSEFGTGDYVNIHFEGWKSDTELSYMQKEKTENNRREDDDEDEIAYIYNYTVGGESVREAEELNMEEYYENQEFLDEVIPTSLNNDISLSIQEEGTQNDGIHILNNKTKEEKVIAIAPADININPEFEVYIKESPEYQRVTYQINAWLNSNTFLFSAILSIGVECDNNTASLYRYDISTGKETLVSKDAGYLQMIK